MKNIVRILKTIFPGLCILFLFGCQQEDEQASLLSLQSSIVETKWILQYFDSGLEDRQVPPEEFRESMYIHFDSDTSFSVGSPCNAGGGIFETSQNDEIHVIVLGSTKKLCAAANMEWENKFFEAIRNSNRYEIDGDRILLFGENIMVLRRGTPPEKPDCYDFESVQIDTDPCISTKCRISSIANGEDITSFIFEDNQLETLDVQYSNPALTDRESRFVYNTEGWLIKVEAVNPVTRESSVIKEVIWNSDGQMQEVITYQGGLIRVRQTFAYDTEGRMIRYIHRELGDELVFSKEYVYDNRGNPVVEKTFNAAGNLGVTRRFGYDYKTNPFKSLGFPTVHEIEPEVLSYFSTNNVVKITEQFPGQSEAVIRRYIYTYSDACVPVQVLASFDLCSVTTVQYSYACEP